MAASDLITKLINKLGEKGLLQAAGVKRVGDLTETQLSKLAKEHLTKGWKPASTEVAGDYVTRKEAEQFAGAITKGSDVSPAFREKATDELGGISWSSAKSPDFEAIPNYEGVDFSPKTARVRGSVDTTPGRAFPEELTPRVEYPGTRRVPMEEGPKLTLAETMKGKEVNKGLRRAGMAGAGTAALGYGATADWGEEEIPSAEPKASPAPSNLSSAIGKGGEGSPKGTDKSKDNVSLSRQIKEVGPLRLSRLEFSDPDYVAKVKELREKEASAEAQLGKAKERTDWARVASILGEGLTRYGAAQQGLREGVDLSNIQIKTPDWSEMIKEDEATYSREKDRVTRDLATEKGLSDERRRAAEAGVDISNKEAMANWEKRFRASEAEKERQHQIDLAKEKDLASKAKEDRSMEERLQLEEKLLQLRDKYKDKPDKLGQERNKALGALQAAYLSGDDKLVEKAFVDAGQFLTPEELASIDKAGGFFGSSSGKAEEVAKLRGSQAATPIQDPTVAKYAQQYNLSYEDAKRILIGRGYTPQGN